MQGFIDAQTSIYLAKVIKSELSHLFQFAK